jgi:Domain of unknown function (DUF1844)
MPDEKEPSAGFKVVDRRPFGEDGRVREDTQEVSPEPKETAKTVSEAPSTPAPDPDNSFDDEMGGFAGVVQFLGTTAMFQLGLMQGPGGERIPADPVSARHTINMLEVLERKTKGNLTDEESKLLEEVLFELRMSFVELEKRQTKKSR